MFIPVKTSWNKNFTESCLIAFRKAIDKIENVMALSASVCLLSMMFGIVLDAAMRYVFNHPLSVAYELNEIYILPAIIFFTISYTMKKKGHIGVTLFHQFFSKSMIKVLDRAGLLIGAIIFGIITWQGVKLTHFSWYNNFVTTGIYKWPLYMGYAFVPLGSSVMTLRCLIEFMTRLFGVAGERE